MSSLENYKEELNNLHAPEALIQRTLLMVHEEEARFEAEKDTDQLTSQPAPQSISQFTSQPAYQNAVQFSSHSSFSRMDAAEGGMTSENYKPAKVSFFSKYKAPIFTVVGVAAAAALLIFAANAGIIGGRSSDSTSMDTSSSDTSSYDSAATAASDDAAASDDYAADSASDDSSMATAASDDYAEDADYSEDYSEEAAADDSASTSKDKSNRDVEADGSSEMAEDTEASLEEDQAMNIALAGGWEASVSTEVTAELSEVFEKAQEGYTGASYSPVAYLGSQIVSGTNHIFLCVTKDDSKEYWSLVYVYENLDGICEITDAVSLDIAASSTETVVQKSEPSGDALVGGWSMPDSFEIDDEFAPSLEETLGGVSDKTVEAEMILGTQVVSGTNYAVLCKDTGSGSDARPYWVVRYIYRSLDGNVSITSEAILELGE